ncbi:unnamed protein product [Vitrella brassicaformis CCMP3155]|uniref:NUC153 domain-containing protein n=1 Tax=Vitrella brassicaformis (strain CCMP3155) TaxID=1169540 RepID=A0A0G4GXM1_VITBC|nr:unnamed protein product [Vitrella brassicaformis CCMP3155]|eukprot:CEM35597.1 unnamed protein product [Vitrella brassicaformis CCMP3155]
MDPRFDPSSNPRFKKAPLKTRRTLIDDRFHRMFDDKAFQTHTVVDPYGRRNREVKADDMRRFYRMEKDDEEPTKGHKPACVMSVFCKFVVVGFLCVCDEFAAIA